MGKYQKQASMKLNAYKKLDAELFRASEFRIFTKTR